MAADRVPALNLTNSSRTQEVTCELPYNHDRELLLFNSSSFINRIHLAIILSLLIIPTIVLNTVILIAMVRNRSLWRSATILIGFLAITDSFVGIFSMPLYFSTVIFEMIYGVTSFDSQVYCTLVKAALNAGDLGTGWSFFTISLITFERYVAIFMPFWYRKHVRTSIIVKIIIIVWSLWALVVLLLTLNIFKDVVGYIILVFVTLAYALALPADIRIVCLLNKIAESQTSDSRHTKIDRKGSITCVIMVVTLLLCYTPLVVVSIFVVISDGSSSSITYAFPWTRMLLLANSFFNPLIYLSRNKVIRRAANNILKKIFKRANPQMVVENMQTVVRPPSTDHTGRSYGLDNRAAVVLNETRPVPENTRL